MACPPVRGEALRKYGFKAINARTGEAAQSLPLQIESKMAAKTDMRTCLQARAGRHRVQAQ